MAKRKRVVPPNRSGLCMCGCGKPVRRAKLTNAARLIFKGEYLRYIHGHAGRRTPPDNSYRRPVYEPTPGEIREGCAAARENLTEAQLNKRIVDSRLQQKPVQPLVIHVSPALAAELNIQRIGRRGI